MSSKSLKSGFLILSVVVAVGAPAREKAETWLEVRSPHFLVVTNAGEKQARRVADQFERIRSVFHMAFPSMRVDPNAPIIVIATKDERSFKSLVPESWLQKGQLKRSGMFLRGPEKNYVLLRIDAEGQNPYHIVFHEYTHLLLSKNKPSLPLWLDEGLAEFYGNSEILGKEVGLGRPSEAHVVLLRENKLLPLDTLFAVNHSSPYYNEEDKGSIFYAECWALTHYLMKQRHDNKAPLVDLMTLLSQGVETSTATARAFGDLKELQKALEAYVRQSTFYYMRMKGSTEVDEDAFKLRELSPAESAVARGDFLVYNRRYLDAKSLLEDALRLEPDNAQAQESMGFLEFQLDHRDEAKRRFTQAVKLDSKSYLAHYYYAAMTMQGGTPDAEASAQIESSLRSAIQINPEFAPAYNALATFYGMKGEKLEDARILTLQAVQLEPGNVMYVLTSASLLLRMNRPDDAVKVGEHALVMAQSNEERATVQSFLDSARKYPDYMTAQKKAEEDRQALRADQPAQLAEQPRSTSEQGPKIEEVAPPVLRHRDRPPRGQRDVAEGTIRDVRCSMPSMMDLTFDAVGGAVRLHSDNYFEVVYTAKNFTPTGELLPCTQLQGKKARIVFFEYKGQRNSGELVSIELTK